MQGEKSALKRRKRYRFLYQLEAWMETPMFLLAIFWLYLFILELAKGLTAFQEKMVLIIWILFIVEFFLKVFLAINKIEYIKKNWLTAIALIVPAFRAFRLLRALRILRSARVANVTKFVRALTSTKRFINDVKEAQGDISNEMNCGYMISLSKHDSLSEIQSLAEMMIKAVSTEMISATGIKWTFDYAGENFLQVDEPKMPAEFLPEAGRKMAEGPFDLLIILTDVDIISRKNKSVPGLASPVTRMLAISTRQLSLTGRGQGNYQLDDPVLIANASTLLLHLIGHVVELKEDLLSRVMRPFIFNKNRRIPERFNKSERKRLHKRSHQLPEHELRGGGALASFFFHLIMGFKHFSKVAWPLLKNRSIFLSLSLPSLATAAVAPALLLVFTAEIWDAGINMPNSTAIIFATLCILGASFYLTSVQSLLLPRKEDHILTEHLAVANVVIYMSIFMACIGLFLLLLVVMLLIEIYIFPEGLMKTWLTIERANIGFWDQFRLAAFISTIGVATGALAGGMEGSSILKHLALFKKET